MSKVAGKEKPEQSGTDAKSSSPPPPQPDIIVSIVGDFKAWQCFVFCWIITTKFSNGYHNLATVFFTAPLDFNCSEPSGAPACSDDCKKIQFDHSVFEENVISEWNLVCSRSYLASFSQSAVMFGVMAGSIVFGAASDRYGRRPTLLLSCFIQLIFSPIVSFSTWFWLFCVLRFLVCFATGGMMIVSFVIMLEVCGESNREILSMVYHLPFSVGYASLPLFAYFLRHWKTYNLGISVFAIIYIAYIWTIPETPRWLFSTGRIDRATKVLERAAKFNKMPTEGIKERLEAAKRLTETSAEMKRGTLIDLFRHPKLCLRTIIIAFNWLTTCIILYGTAQYMSGLTGNIFINVTIGALLGVPGILVSIPLTKYCGRKYPLIGSNILSGTALLIITIFGRKGGWETVTLAGIGIFGSMITFPISYLYSGELFPTVVRNSGVGFASFVGRAGSIVAPFVAQTREIYHWLPPLIFGIFSVLAAVSLLLLPETKGHSLPETIEEGEKFTAAN